MTDFKVVRNEFGGWDVIREGENSSLSNHATREGAVAAARLWAAEEGGGEVRIDESGVHSVEDESGGTKTVFLILIGLLLLAVTVLIVISLIGALTGFGA